MSRFKKTKNESNDDEKEETVMVKKK